MRYHRLISSIAIAIIVLTSCSVDGLTMKTSTTVVLLAPYFDLSIVNHSQQTCINQSNEKGNSLAIGKTIAAQKGDVLEIELIDLSEIDKFGYEVSIELLSEHFILDKAPYKVECTVPELPSGPYTVVSTIRCVRDETFDPYTFKFNMSTVILAYIQIM